MKTTEMATAGGSRGFASMAAERQRAIARKGGQAAHAKGTAHEFTSDEARAAGQKGGQRVSANREHMSRIGRAGGKKSAGRRQQVVGGGSSGSSSHGELLHASHADAAGSMDIGSNSGITTDREDFAEEVPAESAA